MEIKNNYSGKTYKFDGVESPLEKLKRLLNSNNWDVKAMLRDLAYDDEVFTYKPDTFNGQPH